VPDIAVDRSLTGTPISDENRMDQVN
jgi:hypothetical protein